MRIVRKCIITGTHSVMNLAVTHEQLEKWRNGMLIHMAMPHLTPDEREFLISGMRPATWDAVHKDSE
jgi:hypothetical protein